MVAITWLGDEWGLLWGVYDPPRTLNSADALIPNGELIVNPPSPRTATSILTVGGQTFTANLSAFSIGSQRVEAGGKAVTVSETRVRLDGEGRLVIGGAGGSSG